MNQTVARSFLLASLAMGAIRASAQGTPPAAQAMPIEFQHEVVFSAAADAARQLADRGDQLRARAAVAKLMRDASTDAECVRALITSAHVRQRASDAGGAMADLDLAHALAQFSPEIQRDWAFLDRIVQVQRAELAWRKCGDLPLALDIYDELGADPAADARFVLGAQRNAIGVLSQMGRHREAVDRIDALLGSPEASLMSSAERTRWQMIGASETNQAGDFAGSIERYRAIWLNRQAGPASTDTIEAGVQVAGTFPAMGNGCDQRGKMIRELLDVIDQSRAAGPHASVLAELDDLEQQTLVHAADSEDCPGQADFAAWARARLKGNYRSLGE